MKYLGIDYGKRKVGLAISEGEIATPFKVVQVSALKDAIVKISAIIDSEEIDQVIVGIPESGEARKITEKFIKELKNVIPQWCDIVEVEETLTSQNAKVEMIRSGVSRKNRRDEDSFAAAIILQNYLNEN